MIIKNDKQYYLDWAECYMRDLEQYLDYGDIVQAGIYFGYMQAYGVILSREYGIYIERVFKDYHRVRERFLEAKEGERERRTA